MNNNRKTAILVGALFLISYFGVFAGYALLGSVMDTPDYLTQFHPNKTQVMSGVLLELVNGIAVLGIAVTMYPLLKKYNEAIALGYVAFRVLECGMQIAMDMSPLSLLALSQNYIETGAKDPLQFETLGALYLAERNAAAFMLMIFFVVGAMLFYYLLYRSQLVPRFISIWGVIGLVLIVTMNILGNQNMILALPIIGNEIFLAVWLLIKGFSPSTTSSMPAMGSPAIAS